MQHWNINVITVYCACFYTVMMVMETFNKYTCSILYDGPVLTDVVIKADQPMSSKDFILDILRSTGAIFSN